MKRMVAAAACMLASMTVWACPTSGKDELQVAFAPEEDVEGLIIKELGQARQQILVQAYLFTSRKIASALILAHRSGIDVRVLADAAQASQVEGSLLPVLSSAGIPVWLQTKYQNAHDKIILIDPQLPTGAVITGSFNLTWTAQHKNAENMVVVRGNGCLSTRFLANWQKKQGDAVLFMK